MSSINYSSYEVAAAAAAADPNLLAHFKRDERYTAILEHVSEEQGRQYLDLILAIPEGHGPTFVDIRLFCASNDKIGDPVRHEYDMKEGGGILYASPTSLRYVYHAHLILSHCKKLGLESPKFVEIGGGYGGLAAAILFFAQRYGIRLGALYRILDLPGPLALQRAYLKEGWREDCCSFLDASTYGEGIQENGLFLISNYCFSEIDPEHRALYKKILFPKVAHGFLAWNWIPFEPTTLPFKGVVTESETPLTGPGNLYVRF